MRLALILVVVLLAGCTGSACADLGGICVDPTLADIPEGGSFVDADCASGEACLVAPDPDHDIR